MKKTVFAFLIIIFVFSLVACNPQVHQCSYTSVVEKAPTCTENGSMRYTCSCGATFAEVFPATGHSWEF